MAATGTILGYERYPKFVFGEPRFPQETFVGRWMHFLDVIDPRTLLTSEAKLQASIELLRQYKTGNLPNGTTDADLWHAQKIKTAIIHPDSGQKIFAPFRMSGFVPFGWPTVVGLLLPNPTIRSTMFWQWINQSHNACVNYANRNASQGTSMDLFIRGYLGAVGTSVGIATGLQIFLEKAERWPKNLRAIAQRFVPLPAVSLASSCNVVLMRWPELSTGVAVRQADGTELGASKVAAKRALLETTVTRALLPVPLLSIPPVFMMALERTSLFVARPWLHLPLNALSVIATFGCFLPVAIALFPQTSQCNNRRLPSARLVGTINDLRTEYPGVLQSLAKKDVKRIPRNLNKLYLSGRTSLEFVITQLVNNCGMVLSAARVHRAVLCARSPVFMRIFTGQNEGYADIADNAYRLETASACTVKAFVCALYTRRYSLKYNQGSDNVVQLLHLAHMYELTDLQEEIVRDLVASANKQNAREMAKIADKFNIKELDEVLFASLKP